MAPQTIPPQGGGKNSKASGLFGFIYDSPKVVFFKEIQMPLGTSVSFRLAVGIIWNAIACLVEEITVLQVWIPVEMSGKEEQLARSKTSQEHT